MSIEERFYSEAFQDGIDYAIERMFNSVEKLDPEKFSGKEGWKKWMDKKQDPTLKEMIRKHENEASAAKRPPAERPSGVSRPTSGLQKVGQWKKDDLEKVRQKYPKASNLNEATIEAHKKALVPVEMKAPTSKYKSTTFRTAEKLAKVPGESVRVAGKLLKKFLGR